MFGGNMIQHYQPEEQPEGAYSNNPYWREAFTGEKPLQVLWQHGHFKVQIEGA